MQGELSDVADLIGDAGFLIGLGLGAVGAAALFVGRRVAGRPQPGWALLFGLTVMIGVATQFEIEPSWYLGLGLMSGAGLVVDIGDPSGARGLPRLKGVLWGVASVGVVWASTLIGADEPPWWSWLFPTAAVVVGFGIWLLGRSHLAPAVGPLVAVVVAGGWVTVPETGMIVVAVGAAIPFALATFPRFDGRPTASGAILLAAALLWAFLAGGLARPWTIAASCMSAASIPMVGVISLLKPVSIGIWRVGLTHLAYVVVVTRIADLSDSVPIVLLGSGLALTASALFLWYSPVSRNSIDGTSQSATGPS